MKRIFVYTVACCLVFACHKKASESDSASSANEQSVGPEGAVLSAEGVKVRVESETFIDRKKIVITPLPSDDIQIELEPSQTKILSFQIETKNLDGSIADATDLRKPMMVTVKVSAANDSVFTVVEIADDSEELNFLSADLSAEETEDGFVNIVFSITKINATYVILENRYVDITVHRAPNQLAISPLLPIRFFWRGAFPEGLSIDVTKDVKNLGSAKNIKWNIQKEDQENWLVEATAGDTAGTIVPVPAHKSLKHDTNAMLQAVTWNKPCTGGGLDVSFGENGIFRPETHASLRVKFDLKTNFVIADDFSILLAVHRNQNADQIILRQYLDNAEEGDVFGDGGMSIIPVGNATEVNSLVRDSFGNVYASYITSDSLERGIIKLNSKGDLSTEFGEGGFFRTPSENVQFGAEEIIIDEESGTLLIAGEIRNSANVANWDLSFHAVDMSTGTLVENLGVGGLMRTNWLGDEFGSALALPADGSFIAAGSRYSNAVDKHDMAVFRFHQDGTLDSSFSGDGLFVLDIEDGHDQVHAIVYRSDGFWLVGGSSSGGDGDLAVALIDQSGQEQAALDSNTAFITIDFEGGEDVLRDAVSLPNNGLLAVGAGTFANVLEGIVVQFDDKGKFLTSFGNGGVMRLKVGGHSTQVTGAQEDGVGRFLITGFSKDTSTSLARPFLARLCAE